MSDVELNRNEGSQKANPKDSLTKTEQSSRSVVIYRPPEDLTLPGRLRYELQEMALSTKKIFDSVSLVLTLMGRGIHFPHTAVANYLYLPLDSEDLNIAEPKVVVLTEKELFSYIKTVVAVGVGNEAGEDTGELNIPIFGKQLGEDRRYRQLISMPPGLQSKNYRDNFVYEKNSREYQKAVTWKARVLESMYSYSDSTQVPEALDFEYQRSSIWVRTYEDWFRRAGRPVPAVVTTLKSVKKIWDRTLSAAAWECIKRQKEQPEIRQIDICRKFLDEYEIEGEPAYPAEKLTNLVSKFKSDIPEKT